MKFTHNWNNGPKLFIFADGKAKNFSPDPCALLHNCYTMYEMWTLHHHHPRLSVFQLKHHQLTSYQSIDVLGASPPQYRKSLISCLKPDGTFLRPSREAFRQFRVIFFLLGSDFLLNFVLWFCCAPKIEPLNQFAKSCSSRCVAKFVIREHIRICAVNRVLIRAC